MSGQQGYGYPPGYPAQPQTAYPPQGGQAPYQLQQAAPQGYPPPGYAPPQQFQQPQPQPQWAPQQPQQGYQPPPQGFAPPWAPTPPAPHAGVVPLADPNLPDGTRYDFHIKFVEIRTDVDSQTGAVKGQTAVLDFVVASGERANHRMRQWLRLYHPVSADALRKCALAAGVQLVKIPDGNGRQVDALDPSHLDGKMVSASVKVTQGQKGDFINLVEFKPIGQQQQFQPPAGPQPPPQGQPQGGWTPPPGAGFPGQ